MTTNNSTHRNCFHPNTKSARAKCRRDAAKTAAVFAAADAEWEAEMAPIRAREAAEKIWNEEFPKFCRSEEHTSELQSLMRISYAVFCLKKKTIQNTTNRKHL